MGGEHRNTIAELLHLTGRIGEISARDFAVLSDNQLKWKPRPETWSIAECLQHLILFKNVYLPKIEQAIENAASPQNVDNLQLFRSGFLGNYLVKSVKLRDDNKVGRHLKSIAKFRPQNSIEGDVSALLEQFLKANEALYKILLKATKVHLEQVRVAMPLLPFVRLRLGDMLRYVVYHFERHFVQAQKLQTEENFPA